MSDDSAELRRLLQEAIKALAEAEAWRAKEARSVTQSSIADLHRAADLLRRRISECVSVN
jgi:hypothetical protein